MCLGCERSFLIVVNCFAGDSYIQMREWAEIQETLRFVYCILVCDSCRNGLFTEMMNSECMSDRDYQGWVDFGRRDAE